MTLTTNIIILALLLTIIIGAMYYTRKLQNARRHIQEREQQIADLSDRLRQLTPKPAMRHKPRNHKPNTPDDPTHQSRNTAAGNPSHRRTHQHDTPRQHQATQSDRKIPALQSRDYPILQ